MNPLVVAIASLALTQTPRAKIPADVAAAGLVELTRQGEVVFLPKTNRSQFNAVVVSSTPSSCPEVDAMLMDVGSYAKRWNLKEVKIFERSPQRIRYELVLNINLAPSVPGVVEHPEPGRVVFTDPDTSATFVYTMQPNDAGCTITYSLMETQGKSGAWTSMVRAVEERAMDAANMAAAMTSLRGFAKPELLFPPPKVGELQKAASADAAFSALARHGTAVRILRAGVVGKPPPVEIRRVVEAPMATVLASIRARTTYAQRVSVFSAVNANPPHVGAFAYDLKGFGGRVAFTSSTAEFVDGSTVRIEETITGGDLSRGAWTWRVKPAGTGTEVDLTWDVDVIAGSTIMRGLASFDPMARDCMGLHFALALIGDVVGSVATVPSPL